MFLERKDLFIYLYNDMVFVFIVRFIEYELLYEIIVFFFYLIKVGDLILYGNRVSSLFR